MRHTFPVLFLDNELFQTVTKVGCNAIKINVTLQPMYEQFGNAAKQ